MAVTVPETITVHLGRPTANAQNVTVPFADYIKNVASSEIYPTWPENAIRANVLAQISYALNRVYTEYYRSRGYEFDITNSTAFDQSYVPNRDIFENVSRIVDDVFNDYIVRQGQVQPLFAQYCDGREVSCSGLSQWGTVTLANNGLSPYEILQSYYGNDINIIFDAPIGNAEESYPGIPLRLGSA
ncbi:MAG: spore cortex-lytic protein, partial [Clostridia bacterium]|nr:spore cortex-lytic protein [Clostridia bacterium]